MICLRMIDSLIKHACLYIGIVTSVIMPVINYLQLIKRYVYTGYKKRCFKQISKNTLITPTSKRINGGIVGRNCRFGRGLWLEAIKNYHQYSYNPILKICNDCIFGDFNHIAAINKIIIGNGVLTGQNILIEDHTHGETKNRNDFEILPTMKALVSKGSIIIEDNVWIGDKVVICPGVTIGKSSIIGANSVVTRDIPPFSVAAGIPAKIIRQN